MTATAHLVRELPNDIGGEAAGPIERVEHELEPWEKRCHALADVLDFHKLINTEEKRRGVEALGAEMVGKLSYYERWIVAFANILFQKGMLTPEDLARKMDEVKARQTGAGRRRMTPDGLITRPSHYGAKETMDRLAAAVEARGMTVFARVDHAAGARSAGLELRPTELLLFGNPRGGTPLMQAAQTIGIDLPLQVLVWQDERLQVWLAYDDPNGSASVMATSRTTERKPRHHGQCPGGRRESGNDRLQKFAEFGFRFALRSDVWSWPAR